MTRRSLKPQLNQIRTWVRQGRTDAWIAHQLETTVQQVETFKREHELTVDGAPEAAADFQPEVDLRAEDDALIAAELEAEEARRAEEEAARAEEAAARAAERAARGEEEVEEEAEGERAPRRRGRRGGRGRGRRTTALEGSFDHGEEGYGLWLDPAIAENAVYAEHWAGHRPVVVTVEEDRIIIQRAGETEDESGDEE
ncbi:unannotated protein [freshwater metagenome]|uniref:Unannotated protein n=1 Tax=freshwater metagenome TaxID=449393 RepID=A0A6J7DDT2_9ZZZZ|nr:hypothetical protein [Actinomycetota bacterium]